MGFLNQLKHAWDVFSSTSSRTQSLSGGISYNPNRRRMSFTTDDRSIVTAVLTRVAVDVSMIDFIHADTDENGRYTGDRPSGLNYCLNSEANIDQSAMAFKHEIASALLEDGVVAVTPVTTTHNPNVTGGYDIVTMRVAKVVDWQPRFVKLSVYNDRTGKREEVTMPKENVAIIQNPLYAIINEPNSTVQRLMNKLKLLDTADEQSASNKLDLIIQLPYTIKSEQRRTDAIRRVKDIEFQLSQGDYGIAYADATEKINQLNRPVENNLHEHINYLTEQLYSQLGITKELLAGNASEEEINNYYRRTIEPLVKAITEEMSRKFLTKTARTQGQKVMYMRNMFDFVTTSSIGDLADKLIRNEIASPNDVRSILGFKPLSDPDADMLRNRNMPLDATGSSSEGRTSSKEIEPKQSVKMER